MRLKITRERGAYGASRSMAICVDGQKLCKLYQTESVTLDVPDGAQTIFGRIGWGKTEKYPLGDVKDGAHLMVRTWLTQHPLRMLGIMALPGRFELVSR